MEKIFLQSLFDVSGWTDCGDEGMFKSTVSSVEAVWFCAAAQRHPTIEISFTFIYLFYTNLYNTCTFGVLYFVYDMKKANIAQHNAKQ